MSNSNLSLPLLFFLSLISTISSGMIKDIYAYNQNSTVSISVGSMNSIRTQIPFDYYYLQICPPSEIIKEPDNLGEILTGDKSYISNYKFGIAHDQFCQESCIKKFSDKDVNLFKWFISRNYTTSWYVDKLPAGLKEVIRGEDLNTLKTEVHYLGGIPIGYMDTKPDGNDDYKIYNHFTFTISLHIEGNDMFTIVGFNILPLSINQNTTKKCGGKDEYNKNFRSEKQSLVEGDILFTYDIIFEYSKHTFSSRWDHYLHLQNDNIHWFSLINSSLIIMILSFILLNIFCRAIKRDIEIYNMRVTSEDFIDEFGWKAVCNDVFRRPPYRMLLSSLVGSGIQLSAMVFYTLIFAIIGFLTPEKRGSLLMIMVFLFVFMGVFAGYFSARFYKMFQGRDWLKMSLLTAFLYPSILFTIFMVINFIFILENSSASIKFTDLIALLLLWICCSSPLVLIGSFMGVKKKTLKNPCKVNPVPYAIPQAPWYLKLRYSVLITGLIPFAAVFIELVYIMASIWRHYFYYLFGFLFVVLILLIVLCSEVSILMTYIYLCKGDYNWWWKSFLISGSPSIYVFLYSIYYFFSLNITRMSSILLYFGLMSIVTSVVFLISGTMGFVLTYMFLRKIYSMIKID